MIIPPTSISHAQTANEAVIAEQVRQASTSFYWAMRLLPKPRRRAIFAVYAFCREVDDIADEGGSFEEKSHGLSQWRLELERIYDRNAKTPIGVSLMAAVAEYDLQKADFLAVIDGMEMDATGPVIAPDFNTFDLYCDRVACAVGRLCVKIFGEPSEHGIKLAHHLGRALQITNILRDVAEDSDEGRLYLPLQLLEKHLVPSENPKLVMAASGYAALWRELAEIAANEFAMSRQVMKHCQAKHIRPARIMMVVYETNLTRMQALSDAQLADPAHNKRLVGKLEKLLMALRHGLW